MRSHHAKIQRYLCKICDEEVVHNHFFTGFDCVMVAFEKLFKCSCYVQFIFLDAKVLV